MFQSTIGPVQFEGYSSGENLTLRPGRRTGSALVNAIFVCQTESEPEQCCARLPEKANIAAHWNLITSRPLPRLLTNSTNQRTTGTQLATVFMPLLAVSVTLIVVKSVGLGYKTAFSI